MFVCNRNTEKKKKKQTNKKTKKKANKKTAHDRARFLPDQYIEIALRE